jgi:predicted negative regulator of RcsB-dependent stress response
VEDYLSEKEQWEWLRGQIRQNAPTVIAAIAVTAAALYGWRWWQAHQDAERVVASSKYTQILAALDQGNRTQAFTLMGELERAHAASPYADQARLLAARLYVESNQLDKGNTELTAVMQNSKDQDLALVARLRLARVQIAQGKAADALATLNGANPGAFAGRYHEVRGDAYFAKGDRATALTEYRAAQAANLGGEAGLLNLKIADLAANAPSAPSPTAPAGTAAAGTTPAASAAAPAK